jgi:hypothetical protein
VVIWMRAAKPIKKMTATRQIRTMGRVCKPMLRVRGYLRYCWKLGNSELDCLREDCLKFKEEGRRLVGGGGFVLPKIQKFDCW